MAPDINQGKPTKEIHRLSLVGLIITLGIVYGDIGTSPLYVVKAIGAELSNINEYTIIGSLSCIFWTLTLQTTLKYVIIILRANNKGEGGIFALFALIRKRYKWAYLFALIGGSALLADGIITPSITVTSAIEGLKIINPRIPVVLIVIIILSILFFVQQFGTDFLGKSFGTLMLVWFLVIMTFGLLQLAHAPGVMKSINPVYAIRLLRDYPGSFMILGAVFLATTGAEALYSDLGHCGIQNIRISWLFVKISLLSNYFGQAAWVLAHPSFTEESINPFYAIMPHWFIIPGIVIATIAAIIASQALISGSYTLISEAISLNLWPKMTIKYPTEVKGQMYVPNLNIFLWLSCITVVVLFRKSSAMEAAYGLSITITMLMSTILLLLYLHKRSPLYIIILIALIYFFIEGSFLLANLNKFSHGGWFTILIAGILCIIMYVWYNGRGIKDNLMKFNPIKPLLTILTKIRDDISIPKFATSLIYFTKSGNKDQIESTIVHSLINKQPKKADIYWFIYIEIKDEPYVFEYELVELARETVYRINLFLGFRIETRMNLFIRQIFEDVNKSGEIHTESRHPSLRQFFIPGDIRYVLIDRILTTDHKFNVKERLIMNISDIIKILAITEAKSFHLDAGNIILEKVPLGSPDNLPNRIKRIHNIYEH